MHTELLLSLVTLVCMLNILSYTRKFLTGMATSTSANSSGEALAGVFSISYVTAPSEDVAKTLAEGLVKQKLAGCVNIVPAVLSIYEWKDEIQKDNEVLMIIKSRTSRLEELTKYVRENHPYEVCEVISTQIQQGNLPYLKWLGDIVPEK